MSPAQMLRAAIPLAVRGEPIPFEGVSCPADYFYWCELNRRGAIIFRPPSRWDRVAALTRAANRLGGAMSAYATCAARDSGDK